MGVTGIEVRSRAPYEYRADDSPDETDPEYERLDGVIHFAVDPVSPANSEIFDLDLAPRDSAGLVRFESDFYLIQPVAAPAAGPLLYVVANRGRLQSVPLGMAAVPAELTNRIEPGDGHLLRRGWSVLWVGWQWDVVRRPGVVGLEAPQATDASGSPLHGRVLVQFQPNETHLDELLAHWPLHPAPGNPNFTHRPYPAADVEDPDATLTVRASLHGPRSAIPRTNWRFARDEGGRPIADETRVWLEGGFQPGLIYEVIYRTRICPVVGTGLLATRDAVSFFRHATADSGNPSAGRVDRVYGYGVSQCGRFLRTFLYHGLNLDESGRPVFDGVMPLVAGARRGEFNFRYAQPSVQHAPGLGHLPPFDEAGLLSRQRAIGGMPKVIEINTSSEYWRVDCSLIHTDPSGSRDLDPPPDVRVYLFAGTQHGAGELPLSRETQYGARTANYLNLVNYAPLTRAALENLRLWVESNVEPPPSAFPRIADGTAVPREEVIRRFAELPGAALPAVAELPTLREVKLAESAARGADHLPVELGEAYRSYVAAVDEDLNEVAGLRLPDLGVPLASHTGWNPREESTGGVGQLVDMMGSTLPFARSASARSSSGDPRPAIAERYRDRDDYVARVRLAARALVERRHLLAEDVDLVVRLAGARYDALTSAIAVAE